MSADTMPKQESLTDKIIRLWNSGLSGPKVAEELGVSHGKVAGTIFRAKNAGVKLRDAKIRLNRPSRKPAPPPMPDPEPEIEEEALPGSEGVDRLELKAVPFIDRQPSMRAKGQLDILFDGSSRHKCQWPSWGADAKTGTVCGLPTALKGGIPYCAYHYRCAYNPPQRRAR